MSEDVNFNFYSDIFISLSVPGKILHLNSTISDKNNIFVTLLFPILGVSFSLNYSLWTYKITSRRGAPFSLKAKKASSFWGVAPDPTRGPMRPP